MSPPRPPPSRVARKSKASLATVLLILASLALPALFWRGTWFGSGLSAEKMRTYLAADAKPRHVQHALVQFADSVTGAPTGRSPIDTDELVPLVAAAATHARSEVRSTAAWAMGACPNEPTFRTALSELLTDPVPLVRRNAALALSKFNDRRSIPQLLAMLRPFDVTAPVAGRLERLARKGDPVRAQMHLTYIDTDSGQRVPLASPVDGQVKAVNVAAGDTVEAGTVLLTLSPGEADMWEALRALALVGRSADIPEIKQVADRQRVSARIAQQAGYTCAAIERRARTSSSN